jgi:hypothetical protein
VGYGSTTGTTKKAGSLMGGTTMMSPRFAQIKLANRNCSSHELRDPEVP